MRPVRVALLASGTGTNAQALMRKAQELGPQKVEISFVLSDKAQAPVIEKAQALAVPCYVKVKTSDRRAHEEAILQVLHEHRVDWIFLAGYMRLLSPFFLQTFQKWHQQASQVVNIHPSLLPAYPGVDSISRAYQDRVSESGVSLHLVDEGMDTGPLLRQQKIALGQETLSEWAAKFHQIEHRLYTDFLAEVATGTQKTFYFSET